MGYIYGAVDKFGITLDPLLSKGRKTGWTDAWLQVLLIRLRYFRGDRRPMVRKGQLTPGLCLFSQFADLAALHWKIQARSRSMPKFAAEPAGLIIFRGKVQTTN
jgi:hypothetical protein